MTRVLAVIDRASEVAAVTAVAEAIGHVLGARVSRVDVADCPSAQAATVTVLGELDHADAVAAVLAASASPEAIPWQVVSRAGKPIVLVPVLWKPCHLVISRVLLPLDGSATAAAAVTRTAELFSRAGVDLVVLHVFDETTVPRFWDQAAHDQAAWGEEFLARYCTHPGARLELCSGVPGRRVVETAAKERADLIALGWSQRIDPGRARTVRTAVADADIPVMLLPVRPTQPRR